MTLTTSTAMSTATSTATRTAANAKAATSPADELLGASRRSLAEASVAGTAAERYAAAHLGALRAAAAVLAERGKPSRRRGRVLSVWAVLPQVAPELAEWAEFFAAGARKRQAAEAGIACVSHREADDLVRDADTFVARVAHLLGRAYQPALGHVLLHVS